MIPQHNASNSQVLGAIELTKKQNPSTYIRNESQNAVIVIKSSETFTNGLDKAIWDEECLGNGDSIINVM